MPKFIDPHAVIPPYTLSSSALKTMSTQTALTYLIIVGAVAATASPNQCHASAPPLAGAAFFCSSPTEASQQGQYSVTIRIFEGRNVAYSISLGTRVLTTGVTDEDCRDTRTITIPSSEPVGRSQLWLSTAGDSSRGIRRDLTAANVTITAGTGSRQTSDLLVAGSLGNKTIRSRGTLPVKVQNYPVRNGYYIQLRAGTNELGRATVNPTTQQALVEYELSDAFFKAEEDYCTPLTVRLMSGSNEILKRTTSVTIAPRAVLPIRTDFLTEDFILHGGISTVRFAVTPTSSVSGDPGRILRAELVHEDGAIERTDAVTLRLTESRSAFSVSEDLRTGFYTLRVFWPGDSVYRPYTASTVYFIAGR